VTRRRFSLLVFLAAVVVLAVVPAAGAANECRGLDTCLPVAGPWVVVPAPAAGETTSRAVWELRCPLRGYIVAGIDARVSDPAIDVSFRGETGSPVAPGVTTGDRVVFTAEYAGVARRATTFRPFVGCVPTQGGGGRAQTSVTALLQQPSASPPARPLERRVASARLTTGRSARATATCRPVERLVGAAHAYGFRTGAPPGASILAQASATRIVTGRSVTVRGTATAQLPGGLRVELQAHALCAKGGR
jgi:hypothetical protein